MKIAVAIPVYGDPKSKFTQSLLSAICYTYEVNLQDENGDKIPLKIEPFIVSGLITQARTRLVFECLKWEADYILWCDSDHTFPADAIARLWSHNKDIVGCNYARRIHTGATSPTAAKLDRNDQDDKLCYTTPEKAQAGEIEEVDHLGLGLCLMKASVFDRLADHAIEQGKEDFMPLFHLVPKGGTNIMGEDVFFFDKCRDAGIQVWCDHGLSWEVGHIAERILTNAHAVRDHERWKQQEG